MAKHNAANVRIKEIDCRSKASIDAVAKASEHKNGPAAPDAALPNPKSGARTNRSEAAPAKIGSLADSSNVYFRPTG
ncbi:hypothetical protein [Novosphingobium sp. FKTRR1]|uniref:hypothetical protein n=1 Tax=Novosphingobium sp. FKTRR1 TaxID=2879118 RepID=UPI001CF08EBD|nr:hypothetical protein [Novosphingobium sp. FKTRR1]